MKSYDQISAEIACNILNAFNEQDIDPQIALISSIIVFKKLAKDLNIKKTTALELIREIWGINDLC